jgi:oligoendopeptidase F
MMQLRCRRSRTAGVVGVSLALLSAGACAGSSRPPEPAWGHAARSIQDLPLVTLTASSQPVARAAGGQDAALQRSQIPDGFKWKLDALFASDEAFAQGLNASSAARLKLGEFKEKLGQPRALAECLELYFSTRLLTNKLTLYANLRFDSDQSDTQLQQMNDRALDAMNALIGTASFVRQQLLSLSEASLNKAIQAEPRLAAYRPYMDEVRRRRSRVLGTEAERVLSLAGDNLWAEIDLNEIPSDFEKAFGALSTDMPLPKVHDEAGQQIQLTLSNYGKIRTSLDRKVRQEAVESLLATLRRYEHVSAADLAGQMRLDVFFARARGYATARDAYLDKENVDPAVYDNLIRAVRANLGPLHRYVQLRKTLMGLPDLHVYDLYPPMIRQLPMRFSYEDAARILPQALAPLGDEYLSALRQGLDPHSGWIDLLAHKGKKSGAFSSSVHGVHPFIKLNYFEQLTDLSTLAHEFGHALHSHLAMTHQPYVTSNYAMFIAEIASTFNEKMLNDYLVEHAANDDERLYALNSLVDRIRTTLYRQTQFAEFELAAHTAAEKGTPVTAELLNGLYGQLLRDYYGPGLTLGANDEVEWAYVPHFYYKYYLYSYATGISSGIALAQRVKTGGEPARDAYLGMLKAGCSKPPLELLRAAGVDLARPQAIEEAAKLMDQTLAQMERIVAKRNASQPPAH